MDSSKDKNIGMKIIIVVFVLLTMADLATTLRFGDLIKYLEVNPVYQSIGLIGIVALNIILMIGVIWLYYRSKNVTNRFLFLNLIVTVCAAKIIAVVNNIQVGLNPPTLQQAMQVTTQVKVQAAVSFGYMMFIPYLIAIITFMLFKKDHNVTMD